MIGILAWSAAAGVSDAVGVVGYVGDRWGVAAVAALFAFAALLFVVFWLLGVIRHAISAITRLPELFGTLTASQAAMAEVCRMLNDQIARGHEQTREQIARFQDESRDAQRRAWELLADAARKVGDQRTMLEALRQLILNGQKGKGPPS